MKYRVLVQPAAEREIDAAYLYLLEHASAQVALNWLNEIERAIETLETMPRRRAKAPEDVYFEQDIRQLLVDPYRILFTIEIAGAGNGRHGHGCQQRRRWW